MPEAKQDLSIEPWRRHGRLARKGRLLKDSALSGLQYLAVTPEDALAPAIRLSLYSIIAGPDESGRGNYGGLYNQ